MTSTAAPKSRHRLERLKCVPRPTAKDGLEDGNAATTKRWAHYGKAMFRLA